MILQVFMLRVPQFHKYFNILQTSFPFYLLLGTTTQLKIFRCMINNHNSMLVGKLLLLFLSFTIAVNTYNSSLALQLAYYSYIAYQSTASIDAWNCPKCSKFPLINTKSFTNAVGELQGFSGYSNSLKAIILSFRGSVNLQNWIINLATNMVDYPGCAGCRVHNGFYTGYNLIKNVVNSQLTNLRALHRNAAIYITGHSLGGAIAVLSTLEVKSLFGGPTELYTFGQPRVGNSEFAKYFSTIVNLNRVIHYADLVPHIPLQTQGFVHSSTQIWYDEAMQIYKTCPGDSPTCSNSVATSALNTNDHKMDAYIQLKVVNSLNEVFGLIAKQLVYLARGERLRRHSQ